MVGAEGRFVDNSAHHSRRMAGVPEGGRGRLGRDSCLVLRDLHSFEALSLEGRGVMETWQLRLYDKLWQVYLSCHSLGVPEGGTGRLGVFWDLESSWDLLEVLTHLLVLFSTFPKPKTSAMLVRKKGASIKDFQKLMWKYSGWRALWQFVRRKYFQ